MIMKKLPVEVQSLLCASVKINNYKTAVEELVYNALDAESTCIAVRIDFQNNRIQCIDNGIGIPKSDLPLAGSKHASSKYVDMSTLKSAPGMYGFKGLSLFSIIEISKGVKITSRCRDTSETWEKVFYKSKQVDIRETNERPSKGTTVEIEDFLYNLKIQKINNNIETELFNVKRFLEQISLVHYNVSLSLRDDSQDKIVFKLHKNRDIFQTFSTLFNVSKDDIQELGVEKNNYKVKAYIGKTLKEFDKHQWIYLNRKFLQTSNIHKHFNKYLSKVLAVKPEVIKKSKGRQNLEESTTSKTDSPFYFIFLECPYIEYDIVSLKHKSVIEFKNWHQINSLLEKLAKFYVGDVKLKKLSNNNEKIANENKKPDTQDRVKMLMDKIMGNKTNQAYITQMQNGLKGKVIKRKKKKNKNIKQTHAILTEHSKHSLKELLANKGNIKPIYKTIENTKLPILPTTVKDIPDEMAMLDVNNIIDIGVFEENIINKKTTGNNNKTKDPKCRERRKSKRKISDNNFDLVSRKLAKKCDKLDGEIQKMLKGQNSNFKYTKNKKYNLPNKKSATLKNDTKIGNNLTTYDILNADIMCQSFKEYSKINEDVNIQDKSYIILSNEMCALSSTLEKKHTSSNFSLAQSYKLASHVSHESIKLQKYVNSTNKSQKCHKLDMSNKHSRSSRHEIHDSYEFNYRPNKLLISQLTNILGTCKYNKKYYLSSQDSFNYYLANLTYNSHRYSNQKPKINISKEIKRFLSKYSINNFNNTQICNDINDWQKPTSIRDQRINLENSYKKKYKHQRDIVPFQENCSYSIDLFTSKDRDYDDQNFVSYDIVSSCDETTTKNCTYTVITKFCNKDESNQLTSIDYLNHLEITFEEFIKQNQITNILSENKSLKTKSNIEPQHINNLQSIVNSIEKPLLSQTYLSNTKHHEYYITKSFEPEFEHSFNSIHSLLTFESKTKILAPKTMFENKNNSINHSIEQNFVMKNRNRFLPKGMSQIYKNCNSKIICDYAFEEEYYKDSIYEEFMENIENNCQIYQPQIQKVGYIANNDINVNPKMNQDHNTLNFDSDSLKKAQVFGQVDMKFIAAKLPSISNETQYLVLFDQHAVHERVRLENNLEDYLKNNVWKSIKIGELVIKLSKEEVIFLHNHTEKIHKLGLRWKFIGENEIQINAIPEAIIGKNQRQAEIELKAVKSLIREEIEAIKSQKGCITLHPKSIMNLVLSEACRYAVKFGDKLTKAKCVELINSLSVCKTPFQCAHGRPVMAVLMDIGITEKIYNWDFVKLQQFKKSLENKC